MELSSSHRLLQLEQIAVIADIGGGFGVQLNNILDAFSSCRGVLFDNHEIKRNVARATQQAHTTSTERNRAFP